jgi:hypothetical protein
MVQFTRAMIDVSLARPAFKENRDGKELLTLFDGSQKTGGGALAHVPFAVKKFIMALARGDKIRVDVEIITFDADLAVDDSATTRMIGETERYAAFRVCRILVLSQRLFRNYVILLSKC